MQTPKPSRVFHRTPQHPLPTVVAGDGPYLIDSAGKRYLDGSGGAGVSCLGHSHPKVIKAIQDQVAALAHVHTSFFTNEPMERLAALIAEDAPGDIDHVFFVSGGSEAVESALKLARQYFLEKGEASRHRIVSRRQSYHGNTLGALSAGGNLSRRPTFAPLLIPDVIHLAPCYAYRDQRPGESDAAYVGRLAAEFDDAVRTAGPETIMCFIAEPVVGASLGAVPPVEGYFAAMRAVCDRYGILMIADEVMCGMGRTGYPHAIIEDGVAPDMITVAKGLGGGYQPIGALLVSKRIYDAIEQGSGSFMHSHTYNGHIAACAGALAVQQVIREEGLIANVRERGRDLEQLLHERLGNHPHVGNIRGRGLFQGVEIVADRSSKRPYAGSLGLAARLKRTARDHHGLICYPMGGVVDGRDGDNVILAPPFNSTRAVIEEAVAKLGAAIDQTLAELPR